jgi:hypothetical protein
MTFVSKVLRKNWIEDKYIYIYTYMEIESRLIIWRACPQIVKVGNIFYQNSSNCYNYINLQQYIGKIRICSNQWTQETQKSLDLYCIVWRHDNNLGTPKQHQGSEFTLPINLGPIQKYERWDLKTNARCSCCFRVTKLATLEKKLHYLSYITGAYEISIITY